MSEHALRCRGPPVVTGHVPRDGRESELADNAKGDRCARAKGWAHESATVARRVEDDALGAFDLRAHLGRQGEDQVGMVPGVDAEFVAARDEFTRDVGSFGDKPSHQKERGFYGVTIEYVEQAQRP